MTPSRDHVEQSNSLSYIDLLIDMLIKHEKNMNQLIERLEKVSAMLSKIAQRTAYEKKKRPILIYI